MKAYRATLPAEHAANIELMRESIDTLRRQIRAEGWTGDIHVESRITYVYWAEYQRWWERLLRRPKVQVPHPVLDIVAVPTNLYTLER